MKNQTTIAAILLAAACFTQAEESVAGIADNLASTSPTTDPAASEAVQQKQTELTPAQIEKLSDESMRLYAEGDYLQAAAGFEKILETMPAHALSRYFLSRINARLRRNAEDDAIQTVEQAWNGMILRNYPLTDETIQKLKLSDADEAVDVSSLFEPLVFEDGAYAVYRPKLKKIVVCNTKDTIEEMEQLLAALEAPLDGRKGQIEIETRFIEFAEGALEELGFEWSDVQDSSAQSLADDWSVKDGESLFAGALRTTGDAGVFDKPGALGLGVDGESGDWTASRLVDGFNDQAGELKITGDIGNDLDLLVRAIDQTSGADVLSAPRVVTRSGQSALIQVGQRHYFPEVFEVGASGGTIVYADYQDFEESLMGVELEVKPKLIESDLIEMDLNPVVKDLVGWRNYEVAPADSSYTWYQYRIGMTYEHDAIRARLPIFRKREIKTRVTIKDGSTIGMGGLISEKTESFSDRVPVLGSVPLIGRLFRSEGERSVKRNLMILVSARKVMPNGRLVQSAP